MASKVWFITGTSKGFGRVWAEAALARGDRVAATARDVKTLAPLVERFGDNVSATRLDVTDKKAVDASVAEAHAHFGRLDVVVNNAGYGQFGAIEEVSEAEARAQMETNLFGALWVTQAALPFMRRTEIRPHHSSFIHRRGECLSHRGYVSRLEVGTGGLQPKSGQRGGGVRHLCDAHRACGLRHRVGRPLSQARGRRCPPIRARAMPSRRFVARIIPVDPEATGSSNSQGGRCAATAAACFLRRGGSAHDAHGVWQAAWKTGRSGTISPSNPRATWRRSELGR